MKTDEREFPRSLNEPQPVAVNEQVYQFSLSPFDLPVAYRHKYDSAARKFCVEFRYLGEESEKSELTSHDGIVTLRVGKETGNLYEVQVAVPDTPKPETIEIAVRIAVQELDSLSAKALDAKRRFPSYRNPQVVSKFLRESVRDWKSELVNAASSGA